MKNVLILITAILLAGSAQAGEATKYSTAQGHTFVMCDNQTATSICDSIGNSSGSHIYAVVEPYEQLTFIANNIGDDSCSILGVGRLDNNSDAISLGDDLSSQPSKTLSSTPLTTSDPAITLTNTDWYAVWITCTASGGMDVSVEMRASYKTKTR